MVNQKILPLFARATSSSGSCVSLVVRSHQSSLSRCRNQSSRSILLTVFNSSSVAKKQNPRIFEVGHWITGLPPAYSVYQRAISVLPAMPTEFSLSTKLTTRYGAVADPGSGKSLCFVGKIATPIKSISSACVRTNSKLAVL